MGFRAVRIRLDRRRASRREPRSNAPEASRARASAIRPSAVPLAAAAAARKAAADSTAKAAHQIEFAEPQLSRGEIRLQRDRGPVGCNRLRLVALAVENIGRESGARVAMPGSRRTAAANASAACSSRPRSSAPRPGHGMMPPLQDRLGSTRVSKGIASAGRPSLMRRAPSQA